ncbi:MAG: Glu/Leu/Phe/Val dehydrogenase [Deltaproteobacteria bacterium]|nr:Glu/Leu/Phe/Val dehydrogenase [Deltaproteobacteria bacterium]
MSVFEKMAERDHEQVVACYDEVSGLKAIICIHNTTLGPALGGCRMYPYESEDDALDDVLRLARGMTYKSAAAGLNLGGGKAVIMGDPKKMKSEHLFRAYGRFIQGLNGRYITAEDVGTSVQDMEWVRMETDHVTGISRALGGSGDPSPVTALGVYEGIKASLKWSTGSESLAGKRVAVQGVGHVGYHLVRYLHDGGAKISICDIDQDNLKRTARDLADVEVVVPEAIYDQDCDIYAPCAMGGTVNSDTIPRLKCSIIAGSANNTLLDEDQDAKNLRKAGILYAPDYVVNAGGLINVANELEGYNSERALQQASSIYDIMTNIFQIARDEDISPHRAANALAERRIQKIGNIKNTFAGNQVNRRNRGNG